MLRKYNTDNKRKSFGFTLAEVLITLGIIGVVAALTVPALINATNDAEYKNAYKKAFSVGSQSFLSIDQNNLITMTNDTGSSPIFFNLFMNNFKTTKICNSGNNSSCWNSSGELFASSYPLSNGSSFIDSSGMAWTILNSGTYARIAVDTNAFKPPNVFGKDRFVFKIIDTNGGFTDIPAKINAWGDCTDTATTWCVNVCDGGNLCGTAGSYVYHKYYGLSWLSQ